MNSTPNDDDDTKTKDGQWVSADYSDDGRVVFIPNSGDGGDADATGVQGPNGSGDRNVGEGLVF